MVKINYALLNLNRQQQGNKSYWDLPFQQIRYKPHMTFKVKMANVRMTSNGNEVVLIQLHEQIKDGFSSNGQNGILCAMTQMTNLDKNEMTSSYDGPSITIKSNPSRLTFSLYSTDGVELTYAQTNRINLFIECEYIDNDEPKKQVENLIVDNQKSFLNRQEF